MSKPRSAAIAASRGIAAGSCWPSASIVTTPANPCRRAQAKPVCKALPLPRLSRCLMRLIAKPPVRSAVSSTEPSSTTSTGNPARSASQTTPAMVCAALYAGMIMQVATVPSHAAKVEKLKHAARGRTSQPIDLYAAKTVGVFNIYGEGLFHADSAACPGARGSTSVLYFE